MANKAAESLNTISKSRIKNPLKVNLKKMSSKAREYFFLAKNASKEEKDKKLQSVLDVVKREVNPVLKACTSLSTRFIKRAVWHQARTLSQLKTFAQQYLKDVATFLRRGSVVPTKLLSFHLKDAVCFMTGKPGKKYQLGRAFQLGQLKGHFLFIGQCSSPQMAGKKSLEALIDEHQVVFKKAQLKSVTADKGYYSDKNVKYLQ